MRRRVSQSPAALAAAYSGKSAGAIVLALELMRAGEPDRDVLKAAAIQQGRRLVGNLINEPNSPCYTFRPGRHDPFNCFNSVIDGGACSDALAELVLEFGPELASAERDSFQSASLLHARAHWPRPAAPTSRRS